jgi:hypothetical protein
MSASFPYISPAVDLPTAPRRRVVDAGYYDNYGVNVAAGWIYHHRRWLRDHTSGVVLIQIRDEKSHRTRRQLLSEDERMDSNRRNWEDAFNWLTSPLAGAEAARGSVVSFRNDEQLQVLSDWFNGTPPDRPTQFFTTVVFERPGNVGVNWYLSENDKRLVLAGMEEPANTSALRQLQKWWAQP